MKLIVRVRRQSSSLLPVAWTLIVLASLASVAVLALLCALVQV